MANRSTYNNNYDASITENNYNRQSSSRNSCNSDSTHVSHLISQRQLCDSRSPTTCFILFENASSINLNEIYFLEYLGTRARNHHVQKLHIAQVLHNGRISNDETKKEFSNCIKQVLNSIPHNELSSYVVSVRTGVSYFFSKRFRFNKQYSIEEIHDIIQKKIPSSNNRYYYSQTNNMNQLDDSLRSTFCNIKPISKPEKFVDKLKHYKFYVKQPKYVFRIYLQSDDKQTHVCTVDPVLNYSIIEFSKDFQRTSNIDFIRDRNESKFKQTKTYDDIFDFRIQFQYNPHTCNEQNNTILNELLQQFPLIDRNFKNENILRPVNINILDDEEFYISEQLCPYVHFIRRDFGDIYQYTDTDDQLFENFTIYLESSVEYVIDYKQSICKRILDTYGIVYARLNLNTMISSNSIDDDLLIEKLWNMGTGLTHIAGQCTTSETQQSTNYYTQDGARYTAEDEALVQTILKQKTLCSMLNLTNNATDDDITERFNQIRNQLDTKWHCIRSGPFARNKLSDCYKQYFQE